MIRCRWNGEALAPVGHYGLAAARELMTPGDTVIVEVDHPRSPATHNHQFAEIADAWRHLPEALQQMPWAANPDTLRKHGLIVTGFRNVETVDAGSKAAAERVAAILSRHAIAAHGYAITQARGPVVTCWTPQSQSMRAMGAKEFQRSKEAVLNWIAQQIGVTPEQLRSNAA
jgi:hypothetical protein